MELTKTDISCLRRADRIVFRKDAIEAVKEADPEDPFDKDRVHSVPCAFAITDYERSWGDHKLGRLDEAATEAFEMIHGAQSSETWATVVSILRAGDHLTLLWGHGALTTGALREAGMRGDTLHLRATAPTGKARKFFVDATVTSVGCFYAGMLKPIRRPVETAA